MSNNERATTWNEVAGPVLQDLSADLDNDFECRDLRESPWTFSKVLPFAWSTEDAKPCVASLTLKELMEEREYVIKGLQEQDVAECYGKPCLGYRLGLMCLLRIVDDRIGECVNEDRDEVRNEKPRQVDDAEEVPSEHPLATIERELEGMCKRVEQTERQLHEVKDWGIYRVYGNAEEGWIVQQRDVLSVTAAQVGVADKCGESHAVSLPRKRIESGEVVQVGQARYAWGRFVRRILEKELAAGWDQLEEIKRRWDVALHAAWNEQELASQS